MKNTNLQDNNDRERIAEQVRKKSKKRKKRSKIKISLPVFSEIPKEESEKIKRRKKLKRQRWGKVVLLILILLTIICFFLFAPFFKIKSINCKGNEMLKESEIISASHIGMGHNIYRTSFKSAKKGILKLPYVYSAELKRVFPNKIEITIKERKPVAYYKDGNTYVFIDKTGRILEKKEKTDGNLKIPVIENLEPENIKEGEIIKSKKKGKAEFIISALSSMEKCGLTENISSIDIAKANNMTFMINGKLKVTVGTNEKLDYKITFLADKAIKNLGTDTKGFLDVSNGKEGVYRETERNVKAIAEESVKREKEEEEARLAAEKAEQELKKLQEDLEKAQKKLDEKTNGTQTEEEIE